MDLTEKRQPARRIWVLVGSLGSIAAARRFFGRVSPDHPFAFVLTVPIAEEWTPLVADLLARTTPFNVDQAGLEKELCAGDLRVVSIDPTNGESQPIDNFLSDVADLYGEDAGVIVLSGIGPAGMTGCQAILRRGGQVWTQDFESSQFSSLPRYIHDHCEVGYFAPPEALAARVAEGMSAPARAARSQVPA